MSSYEPPEDKIIDPVAMTELDEKALVVIQTLLNSADRRDKKDGLTGYIAYKNRIEPDRVEVDPPWSPEFTAKALAEFCRFFGKGGFIDRTDEGYAIRPLDQDFEEEPEVRASIGFSYDDEETE